MEEKQASSPEKLRKKNKSSWFLIIGIGLLLVAVILAIYFFLRGETKVTGGWPEPETSESLSCEIEGLAYPLFKYDNSNKETTKVDVIFDDDKLKTISLVQQQYYDNSGEIERSEAENHAAMNLRMQDEGLGPDALEMNFARLTDSLKMSLYADAEKINGSTVKYFELDGVGKYDRNTIQMAYEQKGFDCVVKSE